MSELDWKKLVDDHIDASFPKASFVDKPLPKVPHNILEWMNETRGIVDGKARGSDNLICPFWTDVYEDNFWDVMVVAGRQVFKTTFCTDMLAFYATTRKGAECCYVTHDETSLSAFSNQRMRVGTFLENDTLKIFPKQQSTMGSVGELALKNNSTIYMTTDQHGYKHVEGKSLAVCVLDEAQYQDVEYLSKLEQTMRITRGKLRVLGIGGESGSPYERMWNRSDQREWIYKDPKWRDKLKFDEQGIVIDEYLRDVLEGKWITRLPNNTEIHGYHIPQSLSPLVPISIHDAVSKYKTAAKFSIESQERDYPTSIFKTHVLGTFHRATRRPITRQTVLACMDKKLALLKPDEVKKIAKMEDVTISFGVDFGSGPANSSTVVCVLIQFKKSNRYRIAWIEKRPQENQLDQARYLNALYKSYNCELGAGDLGYGAIQVKVIQDGGADRLTGELFTGVGVDKFYGCHSIASDTKPFQIHEAVTDEHGDETNKISIDKTASIQEFIDVLERKLPHPVFPRDTTKARTQLIIPYKDDYDTEWLINDFTAITRKDLAKIEDIDITDPRQRPRKEFNHPRDSVMAIIYALQAIKQKNQSSWYWVSE